MSTHSYKYIYIHHIPINTFERLDRVDLKIHKVGHQECLTIDGDVASH
jgi:hypothetical protein